jgi:hypothetical protein
MSGMWAPPDPDAKPRFHTIREDVRDVLTPALRALGWGVKISERLAAGALLLWAALYLYGAAHLAPSWVWLIVVPLLGIWWQMARRSRKNT